MEGMFVLMCQHCRLPRNVNDLLLEAYQDGTNNPTTTFLLPSTATQPHSHFFLFSPQQNNSKSRPYNLEAPS